MGDCEVHIGFFPAVSPITYAEKFIYLRHFKAIPTTCMATSTAAAQPRIEPVGVGVRTRFEGASRGSTSTGTECPAQGLIMGYENLV
jgi:hypothetical protein